MSDQEDSGIKVVDKRRFNTDGSHKDESGQPAGQAPETVSPQSSEKNFENDSVLHDVSFANLILSLAGSAQMSLGIAPNPFTQKVEKDLNQAKQTIDLLGVLDEKTKGNLSPEEASLMKVVLSDLRLRYVEEKNKP